MCGQVITRSFLWSVSTFAVLFMGIIGCGGDDDDGNDWVGTWAVDVIDGESLDQAEEGTDVSILANRWTFNADGTMEAELAIKYTTEWEIVEVSTKSAGSYSLSVPNSHSQ